MVLWPIWTRQIRHLPGNSSQCIIGLLAAGRAHPSPCPAFLGGRLNGSRAAPWRKALGFLGEVDGPAVIAISKDAPSPRFKTPGIHFRMPSLLGECLRHRQPPARRVSLPQIDMK